MSQLQYSDLGGASTQITFRPQEAILSNYFPMRILGETVPLYTHSYLFYGANEARSRMIQTQVATALNTTITFPCFAKGYSESYTDPSTNKVYTVVGSSNSQQCRTIALSLFSKTTPCYTMTCSFNGVYQPALSGKFIAFSSYAYTLNDLGYDKHSSINTLNVKFDALCSFNETELERNTSVPAKFVHYLCTTGMYMASLLTDGYGFDAHETSVTFENAIDQHEVGWTLGAVLYETNLLPWVVDTTNDDSNTMTITLLIIVSCVLAIITAVLLYRLCKKDERFRSLSGQSDSLLSNI
jgi:Golgi nucleoside diphosphatase